MRVFSPRGRPESWAATKIRITSAWMLPFSAIEWCLEWAAFLLSNWKLLEVLEYLSSLSVLAAVLFYFSESGDRIKQRHYQAWQVINTAQGKGGSGGRIEGLQELNADRVPLIGVDVSGAFLRGFISGAPGCCVQISAQSTRAIALFVCPILRMPTCIPPIFANATSTTLVSCVVTWTMPTSGPLT